MQKDIKNISFFFLALCLLMMPIFSASQAAEVPTLEDIEFISPSANEERITFKLNGTYIPKIFAIKGKKPRVVFDFPNTITARTLNNIITTNGNFIKQIRVGIHEGDVPKTRVVLDLIPDKEIDFDQNFDKQQNALTVKVYYAGSAPTTPVAEKPGKTTTRPAPAEVQEPAPLQADPPTATTQPAVSPPPASPFDPPNLSKAADSTPPAPAQEKPEPTATAGTQEQKTPQKAAPPPKKTTVQPPLLRSVVFDDTSNRGEMIQFKLNDFYPPIVFGIEEGLPRVVCDFKDTRLESGVKNTIKANGKYVKTIRIGKHKNPAKVRVVIDLEPNNNYDLQQVFFKEDNLFVIIVNIMHNTPPVTELEKPLK